MHTLDTRQSPTQNYSIQPYFIYRLTSLELETVFSPIWHNLAFIRSIFTLLKKYQNLLFQSSFKNISLYYGILLRFRRTFPWQHILDHINTFSSTRCRHSNRWVSSRSVVFHLGAIWPVCLFEVFWNGWTSAWFPLGSVNICLRYATTIHVFFFLQTHFFLIFLFPFHHSHNQYNQQQWKYCWGYSKI